MIRAMKLCVLLTLISFSLSGCFGDEPAMPKMDTCHVPYTESALIDNTPCPHDAQFYTCVKIKVAKNYEAKNNEAKLRKNNSEVCR